MDLIYHHAVYDGARAYTPQGGAQKPSHFGTVKNVNANATKRCENQKWRFVVVHLHSTCLCALDGAITEC